MDFSIKNPFKKEVNPFESIVKDLQQKTTVLSSENHKMNAIITQISGFGYEAFTGESTYNELGTPNEIVIIYDQLRIRSWGFLLKNHIASLIINKRVNWQIGAGLLFNSKPFDKPFKDYYGDKNGAKKHRDFIRQIEYQYRNFANTVECDYEKSKTLHEIARVTDYNACGDGDVLLLMRVEKGFPNLQVISGQCVVNPSMTDEQIAEDHTVCEGVEKNKLGEVVAYHVLVNTNLANGVFTPNPTNIDYGTKRIPVYFKGTKIQQAWLYRESDLQKLGETRAMPSLSHIFETLKHVNDYLIANSKNAQLLAQMVFFLEKGKESTGERTFGSNQINVASMSDTVENDGTASDDVVSLYANKIERRLKGNGIVGDLPKGVTAKLLNPQAQSDQENYLNSTLRTIFAQAGTPYEVMISSYDSNYSASMGARSDYQHTLDILTEIIPSNQLYKIHYKMFLYLQIMKGEIECKPLYDAYQNSDIITIAALTNCTFEGTKLKPIDPVKFITALRLQIPVKYRDLIPLNTLENLINSASGGDYESVIKQLSSEIDLLPDEFMPDEIPQEVIKGNTKIKD